MRFHCKRLAEQRSLRWTIEQDIQAGKGESGLDEYETRGWIGWHHHTALSLLSLLALWFLVLQRFDGLEVRPTLVATDCSSYGLGVTSTSIVFDIQSAATRAISWKISSSDVRERLRIL